MGRLKTKLHKEKGGWTLEVQPPEDDPLYDNPIRAAALFAKAQAGDKEAAAELKRMESGDWPPAPEPDAPKSELAKKPQICCYVIELKTLDASTDFHFTPIGVWVYFNGKYSVGFLPGNEERQKEAEAQAKKVTADPDDFFEYLREQSNFYSLSFTSTFYCSEFPSAKACIKSVLAGLTG